MIGKRHPSKKKTLNHCAIALNEKVKNKIQKKKKKKKNWKIK